MDRGHLVPDNILLEMMEKRLQQPDAENGYPAADHVKNAVLLQICYLIHQKRKVAAISVVENLYSDQMTRMKLLSID